MKYKDFMAGIKSTLEEKLTDRQASVEIKSIVKANDLMKDSISIIEPGKSSSPTVYLNDFYEWHVKGGTIEEISDKILEIFDRCSGDVPDEFQRFEDFEEAKSNITLKVLNTAINEAYLEDAACLTYLDLSVVFYCTVVTGQKGHVFCSKISRDLMKQWGVDEQTLYDYARGNTPRLLGIYLREVKDVIMEMLGEADDHIPDSLIWALEDKGRSPMYILSNNTRNSGAGNMFSEGILKTLAKKLESDLYLIPSSIHEVLIIPVSARMTREEVDAMVRDVNRTVLQPEDILADHVYIYRQKEDRIVL